MPATKKVRKKPPLKATPKQERLVDEYLVDLNITAAAIRAGYSPKSANDIGREMLALPHIATLVAARMRDRAERTRMQSDDVLKRLEEIATADPRELIEYRRGCCRFCWGEGFRAQVTPNEAQGMSPERMALTGGIGFNATKPPNEKCPECFGEGEARPYIHDTRNVSLAASRLYAGVKITKDGIEVKMHDQRATLIDIGKHLGLFVETKRLIVEDAGVMEVPMAVTADDWEKQAAKHQAKLPGK